MIDEAGWFDWAVRDPGPAGRWLAFGNAKTPMDAIYHHSFEGWFNPVASDDFNVMNEGDRFPTAWHWTVTRRRIPFNGKTYPIGTLFQHYPVFARLQHANGGNVIGPGGETEGLFNMPLLPEQVNTWLRIHDDMRSFTGKSYVRLPRNGRVGLCEHREAPGAQTACPSERYAPLWEAVASGETGDDELSTEDKDLLHQLVRLTYGDQNEMDRLEGLGLANHLAGRVDRLERDDGPIGQRLRALEAGSATGAGLPAGKFKANIEIIREGTP